MLDELADFYAEGTDWTLELARRRGAGDDAAAVVDAAFGRYAREASNYAGGMAREKHQRPVAAAPGRQSPSSPLFSAARVITIWSGSTVTVIGRWPAQCSA